MNFEILLPLICYLFILVLDIWTHYSSQRLPESVRTLLDQLLGEAHRQRRLARLALWLLCALTVTTGLNFYQLSPTVDVRIVLVGSALFSFAILTAHSIISDFLSYRCLRKVDALFLYARRWGSIRLSRAFLEIAMLGLIFLPLLSWVSYP